MRDIVVGPVVVDPVAVESERQNEVFMIIGEGVQMPKLGILQHLRNPARVRVIPAVPAYSLQGQAL